MGTFLCMGGGVGVWDVCLSMSSHPSSFLSPTSYSGHTPSLYNGDHLPYVGSLSWISTGYPSVLSHGHSPFSNGQILPSTPDQLMGRELHRTWGLINSGTSCSSSSRPNPTSPTSTFVFRPRWWNPLTQHVSHFTLSSVYLI
jgi:hypothetical protein